MEKIKVIMNSDTLEGITAPDGFYKGIIGNVTRKDYTTKDDKKFSRINFEIISNDFKSGVKGNMSPEYCKKYFGYCGLKGNELSGMPCFFSTKTESFISSNGKPCKATKIRFLNMIGENFNPIIMPREEEPVENLGF